MADDASSRILAAATLVEQAALSAEVMSNLRQWSDLRKRSFLPLLAPQRNLIAASGPSHWGAVAELLRTMASRHTPCSPPREDFCSECAVMPAICPSLAALLPLVDQIIRDLGND